MFIRYASAHFCSPASYHTFLLYPIFPFHLRSLLSWGRLAVRNLTLDRSFKDLMPHDQGYSSLPVTSQNQGTKPGPTGGHLCHPQPRRRVFLSRDQRLAVSVLDRIPRCTVPCLYRAFYPLHMTIASREERSATIRVRCDRLDSTT